MTPQQPNLNIEQQADLLQYLVDRCQVRDGSDAASTYFFLERKDLADLRHIITRLRRIAPFENQIKRMVVAK